MKITFTDKTSIDNRPDLSDVEKITGGNINEIKKVVNANADELESTKVKTENLSTEAEALKQKDTAQDTNIQSNTSKIEAINKNIEAINKKNTEQDTNLQKNAKDIEVNQNNIKALQVENAEVKAENERLRSDIESISLLGEAEGESIDLEDSSGARFKKFGVSGNHSQETIKNIQTELLNAVITGGTTLSASNLGKVAEFECKANTQYTIKRNVLTSRFKAFESSEKWDRNSTIKTLKNEKDLSESDNTYTTTESAKYVYVFCWFSTGGDTSSNIPAITSSTECPSLNYPSEIKTVKDNVNVVVCNENLLEINKSINEITRSGVTIELLENGNIRLNGTSTSILWVSLLEINNYSTSSWKKRFFTKGKIYGYYNYVAGSVSAGNVSFNIRETTTSSAVVGLNITADNFKANRVVQGTVENSLNVEYLWINTGTTFNNLEFNLQLKKENNSSDFVEHQEQMFSMPVQQEMLRGDYFDWVNEKEVHTWRKEICNGTEKWIQQQTTSAGFWYIHDVGGKGITLGNPQDILCNKLKGINPNEAWNGTKDGINVSNNINIYLKEYSQNKTLDDFKQMLSENPLEIYYKVKTQIDLPFTDEQKAVAKKIKETLHTYKNITHIYSTDETSPIFDVVYAKDLNTVINNMQAQIINNASGEV